MYLEAVFRFYVLLNHFVGHFFFGLVRFGSFSNTIYRNLALALSKLHINVDITVGFFVGQKNYRLDGCSEWTIFFRVIAPILKPAYASLGIMQFVNVWNDFMQPLMILRKADKMTLPLMLKTMVGDRGTDYGALMFASTCAVLPLLIAFLSASKFFMSGLTSGAVKE